MNGPLPDRLPAKVRAMLEEAFAAGRQAERKDQLAYLNRRAGNARRMAEADPTYCEWARDRARQLDIIADETSHGLHEGMAAMMAELEKDNGR